MVATLRRSDPTLFEPGELGDVGDVIRKLNKALVLVHPEATAGRRFDTEEFNGSYPTSKVGLFTSGGELFGGGIESANHVAGENTNLATTVVEARRNHTAAVRGRTATNTGDYRRNNVTYLWFDINECLEDPGYGRVSNLPKLLGFLRAILVAIGNGDRILVHCAILRWLRS